MRKILLPLKGIALCILSLFISIITFGTSRSDWTELENENTFSPDPIFSSTETPILKDSVPGLEEDTSIVISEKAYSNKLTGSNLLQASSDTVALAMTDRLPYISMQDLLKGTVAGVYAQEPSGEPGTQQNIFIRGVSSPLLNKKDLFNQQPAIYVNGIPLSQDNPFAFDIQKYDYDRIGPATNLLATINPNNIKSIEVIKDPAMLATLGPDAANGAIWITTKNAFSGYRQISVNSYVGFAHKPSVEPINAASVNDFRQPFYNKYATTAERLRYPAYLRDSTNTDYYGPSNWTDLYYRNAPLYSVDLSLTGGSDRANFRFVEVGS